MKKLQITLSLLLTFMMTIGTFVFTFATSDIVNESSIISEMVNDNARDYANSQFKKHLLAVDRDSKSYGLEDKNISQFKLGEPFRLLI